MQARQRQWESMGMQQEIMDMTRPYRMFKMLRGFPHISPFGSIWSHQVPPGQQTWQLKIHSHL